MKTNFLNKLKQGLFLLIAVLATFCSYAQPTQTTTIGGSKTPDIGGFNDIGGKGSTEPVLITILPVVNQCIFAFLNDTGGNKGTSSDTGQINTPHDFDDLDTGGRGTNTNTGEIAAIETGGRNGTGTSSDTGQVDYPDDFDFFDIGGRSTGGELSALDTGGKNSTGGMEMDCPLCPDTGGGNGGKSTTGEYAVLDTGGRGNELGTGMYACLDYEYSPGKGCDIETGGRNGTGTSTGGDYDGDDGDDIGGRNTNSTGEFAELVSWQVLDFQ